MKRLNDDGTYTPVIGIEVGIEPEPTQKGKHTTPPVAERKDVDRSASMLGWVLLVLSHLVAFVIGWLIGGMD